MILKQDRNTLSVYGTIWSGDGGYFTRNLAALEAQYNEVTIHLHCFGGDVFEGNLMYNALNKSKSKINLIVQGIAASMAAVLLLSRPKEDVSIVDNGHVMFHAPMSSGARGTAQDLESKAKLLRNMESDFISKLTGRIQKSAKDIKAMMIGDHWFSADECLAMGLVNKIIKSKVNLKLENIQPKEAGIEAVYTAYASLFTQLTLTPKSNQMKQDLIFALSLEGVTAESSDTAIIDAVKARLQRSEDAKQTAEAGLKTFKDAQIKAYLDKSSKAGLFKDDERKTYETIAETSGLEALEVILKPKAQAPNITGQLNSGKAPEGRTEWTFAEWQEKDKKGLEKMSVEDKDRFNKLFNAQFE